MTVCQSAVIPLPHPGMDKGWKCCWFDWSEDQLTKHTRVKRFHTPSDPALSAHHLMLRQLYDYFTDAVKLFISHMGEEVCKNTRLLAG